MDSTDNREIEASFINVDLDALKAKLQELGAVDHGEVLLQERIFYFEPTRSTKTKRFVRLRTTPKGTTLTYKDRQHDAIDGTEEIEFGVDDVELATLFVQRIGLYPARIVEKKRHSFILDDVMIDIDRWPFGEPITQVEGSSADAVQQVAQRLGLDWNKALFNNIIHIFAEDFGIDFESYKVVTFEKLEQYDD